MRSINQHVVAMVTKNWVLNVTQLDRSGWLWYSQRGLFWYSVVLAVAHNLNELKFVVGFKLSNKDLSLGQPNCG